MSRTLVRFVGLAFIASLAVTPVSAQPPERGWIVVLSSGDPGTTASAHASEYGAQVSHVYRHALRGYAAQMSDEAAARVEASPNVRSVEADRPVAIAAAAPPAVIAAETVPWGVQRIGADGGATGSGVHVYVLDTGIDSNHPDLAGRIGQGYAVERCRGRDCLTAWDDDHGHGTHVAGTVAANDNARDVLGIAPAATLHAVKVLSKAGSGSISGIIAGIDWVAGRTSTSGQASVANMSLGGSGTKTGTCGEGGFTGAGAFHQATCGARHAGVVFAVAAGNSGTDAGSTTPAAFDDAALAVSATKCALSAQSCAAGTDDWPSWSNYGSAVAMAAPGVSVLSARKGGGTTTMSGTSMASPHVAGALARWLGANPHTADGDAFTDARAALMAGAEDTADWVNTSGRPHPEPFLHAP